MAINPRPQKHLINILKTTNNPNFTLFLGAGSSVTSGVKNATALITEWRSIYSEMYPDKNIQNEHWYEHPTEYSELFECLYDQPSQRREFIESCVKDALPSWGYIYLANLLKNNIFNTIFTTNFDDLINEACYSFSSDLKPLVSAHDSSITSVRLTSPRPKIIKLHGDFLFDNIKNTVRELESLEDNMRSKFKQYASEFGMIVIGYSGNDRSIMENLNTLLRYDNHFPHGIYWCVRKGTDLNNLSKELEELIRFPRFHLIEIEGFDEFLADIHNELKLDLQDEVSNPYKHLANRLDNFVRRNGSDDGEDHEHAVINADINKLKHNLQKIHHATEVVDKVEQALKNSEKEGEELTKIIQQLSTDLTPIRNQLTDEVHIIATPNALLAEFELRDENYPKAFKLSKIALEARVTIEVLTIFIKSIIKLEKMEEFKWAKKKLFSIKTISEKEAQRLNSVAVELISEEKYDEATDILKYIDSMNTSERVAMFVRINVALIDKLKKVELSEKVITLLAQDLDSAIQEDEPWLTFGLSLLLNKEDNAYEAAKLLETDSILAIINKEQPIMTLISDELYEKLLSLPQITNLAEESDELEESDGLDEPNKSDVSENSEILIVRKDDELPDDSKENESSQNGINIH
ncbi:SIR2 family protein [Aliivibrio fischeri]|uniref:SIR2 family protein n=1 Tax=Aliivibrio fischeri TaxID=668 RepID=UPI001F1D8083|nr:SIR2 family protein [Aliivibrio fischeri]MCE7567939.1 SIR2 family protein [Aliivibrio fischeri]